PVKRPWTSPLYLLGLLVVATAMVLLPLIYLGLIAGVGYGIYYHATENITIVEGAGGIRGRLLVYIAPLVIGPVALLFMVKPLFARQARKEKRLSLVRNNEPVLFTFVDRLCEAVGAPKPRRIDVDCDINASAAFRRGWLSMFGRDLALTIGVPLAAGLTLRQLAGVLAHEFGHFTQGVAMRLTYVIHGVDAWFARGVYERDTWDEKLVELSENEGSRLGLIFLLARLCVWLARRILWVLMMIGHVIGCVMMRQMEYDADRYETQLAGSRAFEETARRLRVLVVASEAVQSDLAESWKDGRLPDNFPAVLMAKVDQVPKAAYRKTVESVDQSRTGLFDTHPSDAARIRRARRARADGVFRAEGPASLLFRDFEGLSKAVTLSYYQDLVGPRFSRQNLISTDALAQRQEQIQRGTSAAERYFRGSLTLIRPLRIDPYSQVSHLPPKECLAKLKQARQALAKSLPVIHKAYKGYVKADERMTEALVARTLLRGKLKIDPKGFHLPSATVDAARQALERAKEVKRNLAPELTTVESVVRLRLECALALLKVDQVARRIKDAERLLSRSQELLEVLNRVHEVSTIMTELRKEQPALHALVTMIVELGPDEDLVARAREMMVSQHEHLAEVRRLLTDHRYPFEHADGSISLARYALGTFPARDDVSGTLAVVEGLWDNMESAYIRVMGELARIAERVEAAVGLKPQPAETAQKNPAA
ncbi:MAG: M48 family metallopeptidase, partial [Planctomycetota bacterium]